MLNVTEMVNRLILAIATELFSLLLLRSLLDYDLLLDYECV